MATFSWSDTFIAVSACFPCFSSSPNNTDANADTHNPTAHFIPRAHSDELHGLLADPDTDTDAERLSLHSNPGRNRNIRRTKKKAAATKRITLFGYDLFGRSRRPGPIHLPDSDDEETAPAHTRRGSSRSSTTFDSDASPLDTATIEATAAAAAAREEERRQKEEHRARRRERRERRRMAQLLNTTGQDGDFEGFQGSGDGLVAVPPRLQLPPAPARRLHGGGEEEEVAADLDGGMYAGPRRGAYPHGGSAGSRSRSDSQSQSRTSASRSDNGVPPSLHLAQQQQQQPPIPRLETRRHMSASSTSSAIGERVTKKSRVKSKTARLLSHSSGSTASAATSQSASLPSPTSASFTHTLARQPVIRGVDEDAFDGSQGLSIDDLPKAAPFASGFPSTGIRGGNRKQQIAAFLSVGRNSDG